MTKKITTVLTTNDGTENSKFKSTVIIKIKRTVITVGHLKDDLVTSADNVRLGGHPKDVLVTSADNFRLGGVSGGTPTTV